MLERWQRDLSPVPSAAFQTTERSRRRVAPLGEEHDERQRLGRLREQLLEVGDAGLHQLLAEWRIGLERTVRRLEVEHHAVVVGGGGGPSRDGEWHHTGVSGLQDLAQLSY